MTTNPHTWNAAVSMSRVAGYEKLTLRLQVVAESRDLAACMVGREVAGSLTEPHSWFLVGIVLSDQGEAPVVCMAAPPAEGGR